MTTRASVRVQSCSRLRHSSRKRPWKLSTKPFCHATAGLDIDRLDLIGGQPLLDFLGDKLGAIVTPQVGGRSVLGDGPPDPIEHIAALESTVGPQHMTLTGVFVQDRQHAQGSASRGSIRDEVPAPDMAPVLGLRRQPRGDAATHHLALGGRHSQPEGSSQPLPVSFSYRPTLLPQQGRDSPIPVTAILLADAQSRE